MMLKNLVAVAAVGFAAVACAQEGLDGTQTSALEQGLTCTENSGVNPTMASLAVAMATELGTWDPIAHLVDPNKGDSMTAITLSSAGTNLCNSRGGCPNVKAILSLQNDALRSYIPQGLFNSSTFRQNLKSSFDRQVNLEANLRANNPGALPEAHKLTSLGSPTNMGGCGVHYGFVATKPDGTALSKPANLANRLAFYGYGSYGGMNPYIDFRSTESKVYVDPTEGDQTYTGTATGACLTLPQIRYYDPSWTKLNSCCSYTVNGVVKTGKLQILPTNTAYLYCKS